MPEKTKGKSSTREERERDGKEKQMSEFFILV